MSSRYEKASYSTKYSGNHENRLDELLEDLQTSVPHRFENAPSYTSGYREVMKTTESQSNGRPMESSREYHVEYLKPSNSVSVPPERPPSPKNYFGPSTATSIFDKENKHLSGASSYKSESYESSASSTNHKALSSFDHRGRSTPVPVKFRDNVNELDSLLDDLNQTKRTEISGISGSMGRSPIRGVDSGFADHPIDSSTPRSHSSRVEQRSYEHQRYGTVNPPPVRTEVRKEVSFNEDHNSRYEKHVSNSEGRKDLIFTGGRSKEPSPIRQMPMQGGKTQEVYHYESKTSSSRRGEVPPSPMAQRSTFRKYEDVVDSSSSFNRSPSPVRSVQNYSAIKESTTARRSPSPAYYSATTTTRNVTSPVNKTVAYKEYTSKMHQESRREMGTPPPPPRRSPSPMMPPPEESHLRTMEYERNMRTTSPPLRQQFSPSDPSGRTIVRNYTYSSQTEHTTKKIGQEYHNGRPFPSPSPPPVSEQNPPKQLEELMASFSDSEHSYRRQEYNQGTPIPIENPPPVHYVEKQKNVEIVKSNNVAGPPVYYPPGPMFTKKEEYSLEQKNGKGKWNASREANYKYEAGGKMSESSKVKKTVVPCCAPVCCAVPCVVM